MLYVLRREASDSAKLLSEGLEALRIRRVEGNRFFQRREGGNGFRARRGDTVICWGDEVPTPIDGVQFLNGVQLPNKMVQAQRLAQAGVPTVEVSATIRANTTARAAEPATFSLEQYRGLIALTKQQAAQLVTNLQRFQAQPDAPPQPATTWVGRRFNHVGGTDLLHAPDEPDYWVRKEDIKQEFRLHMFNGKSIRAGQKVKRDGVTNHPWVRSEEGGWYISYTDFESKKKMRETAAAAVEALGLQFGAVDLGVKADGNLIVLEVNRAPGLGDGTAEAYVKAVQNFIEAA